jgi:hypothetical protein
MTKKKIKFTVEVEVYEETVKDAARGLTLAMFQNAGDLSHLTAAERIGFQVARKWKESQAKKELEK